MATVLATYTTNQLRSNRRILVFVRAVMLCLFVAGVASSVYLVTRGEWHARNIGVLAPAMAVGVILIPIQVQISVITRELATRKPIE
jgi:hypothetical protein